jgi:nitrogen fixation/metabolism regulation signal transduction histidine kinase
MSQRRKGLSLTYKLVIIILILTLFPLILMAFSSYSTFSSVEQTFDSATEDIQSSAAEQTAATKATTINQTRESLIAVLKENLQAKRDNKIDKYSSILAGVERDADITAAYIEENWDHLETSRHPEFEGVVWAGPENTDTKRSDYATQIGKLSQVGVLLERMDRENDLTSLTYFGTRDNNVVISQDIEDTLVSIPSGFSNVERPWYVGARDTGETVWTNTYVDANTNELVTTVASPVYTDNDLLGVVGFDVTMGVLSNDVLETDPGFAFLLDSSGEAIVYPGMKAPNKTVYAQRTFSGTNFLEDNVSDELQTLAQAMVNGEKGLQEVTIEGRQSFVAYGPLEENDWSVGVAVPVEEVTQPVTTIETDLGNRMDMLNQNIEDETQIVQASLDQALQNTLYRYSLLFLLIIVIIVGLGIYVSNQITQPLIELHEKAEAISKGGISDEVDITTGDEIEALGDSFNRIMRTIKILQRRDAPHADIQTTDEGNSQ